MSESRNHGIRTGLIFITVGLLFLLDRQGTVAFQHSFPVIIIVLGLSMIVFPGDRGMRAGNTGGSPQCRRDRWIGGLWMAMVGAMLWLHVNHVFSFRESWPLFIIAGGLGMIAKGIRRRPVNPSGPGDAAPPASGSDAAAADFFRRNGGHE